MCKKIFKEILFICFIFLIAGCTKIDDSDNYIGLVSDCFTDKKITNDVSLGYKYYVPKGVEKVHDYDYNQEFLVDNTSIYLYVDIISYYYKKELQYDRTGNEYYYKKFNNKKKTGYIKIDEDNGKYLISIVYNYSKIEVYTSYDKLNKMIVLSSIILNSITYNDTVIEKVLDGNLGEFSEFTYEVDKPEGASSNFSQYLEEYVQKEDTSEKDELPDE